MSSMLCLLLSLGILISSVIAAPLNQTNCGNCYYSAFDSAIDVGSALPCLASNGFASGLFPIYSKGNVNVAAANGYQAAPYANIYAEALIQLSSNSTSDQFGAFWSSCCSLIWNSQLHSIWLDLSSAATWGTDTNSNGKIINDFLQKAQQQALSIGILTSKAENDKIVGQNFQYPIYTRVWYQSVGPSDFNDYQRIGSIAYPSVKQYQRNQSVCGVNINYSSYIPYYGKRI
ncbi:Glycoside hydrolase family 25 protein [Aphelenchoides besseyi]|nr:Glycoside hydrolase family 25 protein [Aphelenchoides besseyi]KAI6236673.1 Glycoside hydrolase family 25 protein [Aphelenchoides besseyi]